MVLEVVIRDNHRFFVGSLYPGWVNLMKCISGTQNYPQEISGRVFDDGLSEVIPIFILTLISSPFLLRKSTVMRFSFIHHQKEQLMYKMKPNS